MIETGQGTDKDGRTGKGPGRTKKEREASPERPVAAPPQVENFPAELRERPQWVGWRYEWQGKRGAGKWTKLPLQAKQGLAKANSVDPATWSNYHQACAGYYYFAQTQPGQVDGLGYVFTEEDPFAGVDLDDCLDPTTGELKDWAAPILADLNSYTERSPSGTGLKVIVRGRKPGPRCEADCGEGKVELYDRARFFVMTGDCWPGTPPTVEDRQDALTRLYEQLFPPKKQRPKREATKEAAGDPNGEASAGARRKPLGDDEIISLARSAANGPKFCRLFYDGDIGDYDDDDSRADSALCCLIIFYTRDSGQVDRIFRRSKLIRDKWDERRGAQTYGELTIKKALDVVTEQYEPAEDLGIHIKGMGKGGKNGRAKGEAGPGGMGGFRLGPFTLRPERPRKTAKISVLVNVLRGEDTVYVFSLTSAASSRKEPARVLRQLLGEGDPPDAEIDRVLTAIIADAAGRLAKPAAEGPTIREVINAKVPEALHLVCRTQRGAWSEAKGKEVTRADFLGFTPEWLMAEAGKAVDAPQAAGGVPLRPELLRLIETELKVLWADLHSTLPGEGDVDLGRDTARGRAFRRQMQTLWTNTQTFELIDDLGASGGKRTSRASLISRVRSQKAEYQGRGGTARNRQGWQRVHHAFDAWWRPYVDAEGEERIALAMRWQLMRQAGADLPGVEDEGTLTGLGERFGALAKESPGGISDRLSGGGRLAILSREVTEELFSEPVEPLGRDGGDGQ